jgi:hypothetical protein
MLPTALGVKVKQIASSRYFLSIPIVVINLPVSIDFIGLVKIKIYGAITCSASQGNVDQFLKTS